MLHAECTHTDAHTNRLVTGGEHEVNAINVCNVAAANDGGTSIGGMYSVRARRRSGARPAATGRASAARA